MTQNGLLCHNYALKDKGLQYNSEDMGKTIKFLIDSENTTVFVAEDNEGRFQGCIAGIVAPWICDHSQWILTEQFWWMNPDYRKGLTALLLLKELIKWGKEKGYEW